MVDKHILQAEMHRNYTAFAEKLPELAKTHMGMFALMRDGQIVQFFYSDEDATDYGNNEFDDNMFSVFEIGDQLIELDVADAPVAEAAASEPYEPSDSPEPAMIEEYFPRTIVFASQKGGAGKTTLCGHVAVQAELAGEGPVALVDTDPQGSLAEWWNVRESETPLFVKTHFTNLAEDLSALGEQGVKIVFIDTPPGAMSESW